MAATYPSGIKTFPSYANGDQVTPITINDPDLEITAIETALLQGFGHDLLPDATGNHRSLGGPGNQWYDLVVGHNVTVGGTLAVTGTVTFTGTIIAGVVAADTVQCGALQVNAGATIGGTLGVTGVTTFGSTVRIPSGVNLFFDGGVDTAIREDSADHLVAIVGGSAILELVPSAAVVHGAFTATGAVSVLGPFVASNIISVPTNTPIYFDGGSNTYIRETSADVLQLVTGGSAAMLVTNAFTAIPATSKFYLDGGSNTYITELSGDTVRVVTGGSPALTLTPTEMIITAGMRFFLDSGSDTYIRESSSDNIQFVAGGNSALNVTGGGVSVTGVLTVGGLATVGALFTPGTIGTNSSITAAALSIAGAATVGGIFTVSNKVTINNITGDVTLASGALVALLGHVDIQGNSIFRGTLTVGSSLTTAGLVVNGATTLNNGLAVGGPITTTDTIDVRRAILSNLQAGATASTSPVTIYTATQVHGSEVGGLALMTGTKVGDPSVQFSDVIVLMSQHAPSFLTSQVFGAPATRTLNWSGLNLQLTMSADTYHVAILPILVGNAGA